MTFEILSWFFLPGSEIYVTVIVLKSILFDRHKVISNGFHMILFKKGTIEFASLLTDFYIDFDPISLIRFFRVRCLCQKVQFTA